MHLPVFSDFELTRHSEATVWLEANHVFTFIPQNMCIFLYEHNIQNTIQTTHLLQVPAVFGHHQLDFTAYIQVDFKQHAFLSYCKICILMAKNSRKCSIYLNV